MKSVQAIIDAAAAAAQRARKPAFFVAVGHISYALPDEPQWETYERWYRKLEGKKTRKRKKPRR